MRKIRTKNEQAYHPLTIIISGRFLYFSCFSLQKGLQFGRKARMICAWNEIHPVGDK